MHDGVERRQVDLRVIRSAAKDAESLIVDSRRHLGDAHLAGRVVDGDQVGEGATDVDPAMRLIAYLGPSFLDTDDVRLDLSVNAAPDPTRAAIASVATWQAVSRRAGSRASISLRSGVPWQ